MVDPDLEDREWWVVIMNRRTSFVNKSITMEEHACVFREILIGGQESLSIVILL